MSESGENSNPGGNENKQTNNQGCLRRVWRCIAHYWLKTIRGLKRVDALITAIGTVLLAVITAALAFIAWWQYSDPTLRQTLVASNRAWLTPESAQQIAKRGQPLRFAIAYGNTGKEAATGFVAQQQIGTVDLLAPQASLYTVFKKDTLEDVCGRTNASRDGLVIYPSARMHTYTVEQNAIPEITNRTKMGFIHGCFAYFTFGQERKSEYCFLFIPNGSNDFRAIDCPYGNKAHEPSSPG